MYSRYTTKQFLKSAGRSRQVKCPRTKRGRQWDHRAEFQLISPTLKRLPNNAYRRKGWKADVVDCFQSPRNYQSLTPRQNRAKAQAVARYINPKKPPLKKGDMKYIQDTRRGVRAIRHELIKKNLKQFADGAKAELYQRN